MSWITDLVSKKNETSIETENLNIKKEYLYLSVQSNYVCMLVIDESTDIGNIIYKEEVYLGSYENLSKGQNVKDLHNVLDKVLKEKSELFKKKTGVYVSLPAIGNFFKNINVQKGDHDDMKKLVLAEIKNTLPIDFSQILYAENDLGSLALNTNAFFTVCVQKSNLEKFEKIFKDNNIKASFEIEVFSLARIAKRDEQFRVIIFVNNFYTLLIILHGQIIHDEKILEKGSYEIIDKISKDNDIDVSETYKLVENFEKIKSENRPSHGIIEKYIDNFTRELAKVLSIAIFSFEKKYTLEVKELILAGFGANNFLVKHLQSEFDKSTEISLIGEDNLLRYNAENFKAEDLKRYAQCFGLALKTK